MGVLKECSFIIWNKH